MNLFWITAITIFVLLEKGFPVGNWGACIPKSAQLPLLGIGWFAGIGLIVSGVEVLVVGRRPLS